MDWGGGAALGSLAWGRRMVVQRAAGTWAWAQAYSRLAAVPKGSGHMGPTDQAELPDCMAPSSGHGGEGTTRAAASAGRDQPGGEDFLLPPPPVPCLVGALSRWELVHLIINKIRECEVCCSPSL